MLQHGCAELLRELSDTNRSGPELNASLARICHDFAYHAADLPRSERCVQVAVPVASPQRAVIKDCLEAEMHVGVFELYRRRVLDKLAELCDRLRLAPLACDTGDWPLQQQRFSDDVFEELLLPMERVLRMVIMPLIRLAIGRAAHSGCACSECPCPEGLCGTGWQLACGERYAEAAVVRALYEQQCDLMRRQCDANTLLAAVVRWSDFIALLFDIWHPQSIASGSNRSKDGGVDAVLSASTQFPPGVRRIVQGYLGCSPRPVGDASCTRVRLLQHSVGLCRTCVSFKDGGDS